jgi:hypothetical protein
MRHLHTFSNLGKYHQELATQRIAAVLHSVAGADLHHSISHERPSHHVSERRNHIGPSGRTRYLQMAMCGEERVDGVQRPSFCAIPWFRSTIMAALCCPPSPIVGIYMPTDTARRWICSAYTSRGGVAPPRFMHNRKQQRCQAEGEDYKLESRRNSLGLHRSTDSRIMMAQSIGNAIQQ